MGVGWGGMSGRFTPPFRAYQQIGHSLFMLLFAGLGGAYARQRYAACEGESRPVQPEKPSEAI
jgi:hypothetical protein